VPDRLRRRPGWHPDPTDPTCVRHWDGHDWQRIRNRPAWSVSTTEVVLDTKRAGRPGSPGGPPVFEGPVRPAPERATTTALNAGTELRTPPTRSAPLRSAGSTGPRAGQFAAGTTLGAPVSPPWTGSRRPMAILGLVVIAAVIAVVAAVGWAGPRRVDPGPLPSSFVTQASQDCSHTLGTRPSALPDDPVGIKAEDDQLVSLGTDLRTLAIADHGNFQANDWLDTWGDFTRLEQDRAAALASGTNASTLTLAANNDAARADQFATTNGLTNCTILAASPATMQAIPS
jgi:hypothetical protein